MPRSLPLVAELLPPCDGRLLCRAEWDEMRVVRFALVMVVVAWHQSEFLPDHRPIRGGHDADFAWLYRHLEPLARVSPTVRQLRRVFDPSLWGKEWHDPIRVRQNLRRLIRDATRLADLTAAGTAYRATRRSRRGR